MKKPELKVTTQGQGDDAPIWSHTGSNLSSGSDSQTEADSGISSYQKPPNDAGSTTQQDHTPWYSPDTIRKIDEGDLGDAPLSDRGGNSDDDQEMVSADDGVEEAMGTDPVQPPRRGPTITSLGINLTMAANASLMADPDDPGDTDDEKTCREAFQLIMQGFSTATHTLSDGYQWACKEVQTIVQRSLRKSTAEDHTFVWGASAAIRRRVWVIHPAMDCLGESIEEQLHLLKEACKAGKEATEDILNLLPAEENPYLTPVVPREDILIPALTATRNHTEKAIDTVNVQLSALVHHHVPPDQAGVFLASLLQVLCSYQQEMDGMATSQVILPGQIVPNLWGVSRCVMEGLTLLGPLSCPASWLASLVELVSAEPTKKTIPAVLTTPAKLDSSGSHKGKSHLGSSGKKTGPPKQVTKYWGDPERDLEDAEAHKQEEEKHQKKKHSGPVLSLDEHEESIMVLTSKAIPSRISQAPGQATRAPSNNKRGWGKIRWDSPVPFNSSDDEPLSDKGGKPEPKSRKKDHSTPDLMIVDDDNNDDPLPGKPKGTGKKEKSCMYTQEELDSLDTLLLQLKSEARSI